MTKLLDKLPQWLVWELAIPLTVFNLWLLLKGIQYFQSLLSLFIVATLLAFLLDYLVGLIEKIGVARGYGVLIIVLLALSGIALIMVTVVPTLLDQLTELTTQLPSWLASGSQKLEVLDTEIDKLESADTIDVSDVTTQLTDLLPVELKLLPGQLVSFLLGFADKLFDIVLTTVLTLYLLLYGRPFWKGLFKWLPNDLGEQLSTALSVQFKNYFFGQAVIAALMGVTLALIFYLLQVPFWLVSGLGIGACVFVPFGDWLGIAIVSLLVGLGDPLSGVEVLAACIITDQVVDNVFTPRILGDAVGLNPVWVLLSLLAGAQIGGLLGAVIAVPLAATLKQIVDSFGIGALEIDSLKNVDLSTE
ncbi:AI-2E family transporter [cf. Phormidesmis sp. LEGE 11477]|uniref:AI-2E family transporter n=1 Tax=cf. Phormidesmis sp. LEGE 11477 TaxID=1828680 RepID=UPI00187E1996|nr:AI-2E family transporter [cf. Phormidesmis sp. LEGE 11477]MBE9061145.1 AI-2E family transporter [cf. Phormidesmis sp. LEGE 11477]